MMAAGEIAVCTLKDAVKLSPHWPREAPPLWYVSQSVMVEEGRDALDALITRVLAARPFNPDVAPSHLSPNIHGYRPSPAH